MTSDILNRKGARTVGDIPAEVKNMLDIGVLASVNLTEWLAVDHQVLWHHQAKALGLDTTLNGLIAALNAQKKPTSMNSTKIVGEYLYQHCSRTDTLNATFESLSAHLSDTMRGYATYLVALDEGLSIEQKLDKSLGLIADKHFGVREIAWMALRPEITQHLHEAIRIMTPWTAHEDENIRRFVTESTRPRGVWCKHIDALKEQPDLALPLLEPLKADPAKYVQDSVGNWLNDASKTQPDFVNELCNRWKAASPTKATEKIIKRGLRTLAKQL